MENKNVEAGANFCQVEGSVKNAECVLTTTAGTEEFIIDMQGLERKAEPADTNPSIQEILKDPKVIEMGRINAKFIQHKVKGDWFTVEDTIAKCGFKEEGPARDILDLLCLLEMCYRDQKEPGVIKYKITFSPAARKVILQEELAEAKAKVARLERMIAKISNKTAA